MFAADLPPRPAITQDPIVFDARRIAQTRAYAKRQGRQEIRLTDVIGHNESLASEYHRERVARLRRQTHGDFTRTEMRRYRARLTG